MRHHSIRQQLSVWIAVACILATTGWSCSPTPSDGHRYYGIFVNGPTEALWNANEDSERAYANTIVPIPPGVTNDVPFVPGDTSRLRAIQPSGRHGASDKRFLALNDSTPSHVLAEITLVKGAEYFKDTKFQAGWVPLAIVTVFDSTHGDSVMYQKLKLRPGSSWLYVREDSASTWHASLVRVVIGTFPQDPLAISAEVDSLDPAPVARFKWRDNDEMIWATCAGKCCRVAATL